MQESENAFLLCALEDYHPVFDTGERTDMEENGSCCRDARSFGCLASSSTFNQLTGFVFINFLATPSNNPSTY